MSGIFGIYCHDGAAPDPAWLEQMREAMAFYGPDGGGSRIDGPVGMGHLRLEVNPEDAHESQPVMSKRGMAVSAARLDNRAELLEAFGVTAAEAERLPDGRLASMAFDRWGDEVCSHLEGDWALAAWDARKRRLLLARDACGNATLYYYEGKGFIAFASSMKALLALPGVRKEPDRLRLAEVLVAWQQDAELTAYKGFRRLVWAHAMEIGPEGKTRIWRHWSPEGRESLRYRHDEEYEEAFQEHFARAVRSCLRTRKAVAATLSGGRDSGSVTATAAPILAAQGRDLTAYTSVPWLAVDGAGKERLGNEWEWAHATAVMAGTNVDHRAVDAAGYGVMEGIEHVLEAHDGPSHAAGNHYWLRAVTEAAAGDGAAVALTGQMGNATVSWGGNGLALLALVQGQAQTAMRLLLHAEANPWLTLKRQVLKPLLKPGMQAFRRLRSRGKSPWLAWSAINPQLAAELDIAGRMRAADYHPASGAPLLRDEHPLYFRPQMCIGTGLWTEVGARHSIAFLDPTANLRLVEFILRVPDDQFRRRGQKSWLFSRGLRGRLPEAVLEGRRKGLQAADLGNRILRELLAFRQTLESLDGLPAAREFLNLDLLHRCLDELVARVDPETTARASQILMRGLGVGLFLRRMM